ncbi:MAG TPA: porin [Chromatiales bacterium]|nr:porin [Thiotrichales bacterium]HIP68115.1 porin [Chromatiales bacterium]
MRKNTLAIAIAAALAVPMAAQADTTLYGQGNASIDFLDDDVNDGTHVSNNSSRIGVKGSHKLNDSLSAVYQMEWGVTLDGDSSTMSARNRIVGLKGGFGTFVLGRHDTPVKVIGRKADLFWSTQLGQNRSITAENGHDARASNVIGYISPNFGPAHVFAVYIPEDTTTPGAPDAFSVALIVGGGKAPYFVGVGYENLADLGISDALRVTGTYKFGPVKLAGFYEKSEDIGGNGTGVDQDMYGIGVAFTAGANTFKGQYYIADDRGNTNDSGAQLAAIGWDYALSKSTAVYAQYAQMEKDANTVQPFALGGSGHGESVVSANNGTASGLSAGIRVKF